MAKLTTQYRKAMPAADFALPAKRAFPIENKSHARAALSGASRALHAGNITHEEAQRVRNAAMAKLKGG